MIIGKPFNTLVLEEYYYYIDNRKKYNDFNELWLFRSIFENKNLDEWKMVLLRDYIQKNMSKVFEFMQVRHPDLYVKMYLLWKTYTKADEENLWNLVRLKQEEILHKKRIKHRNFWDYSKHNCWFDDCNLNGIMVQKWSWFCENIMHFSSDKHFSTLKDKSKRLKKERKAEKNIVNLFIKSEGLQ